MKAYSPPLSSLNPTFSPRECMTPTSCPLYSPLFLSTPLLASGYTHDPCHFPLYIPLFAFRWMHLVTLMTLMTRLNCHTYDSDDTTELSHLWHWWHDWNCHVWYPVTYHVTWYHMSQICMYMSQICIWQIMWHEMICHMISDWYDVRHLWHDTYAASVVS